jgi:hypothetical protein
VEAATSPRAWRWAVRAAPLERRHVIRRTFGPADSKPGARLFQRTASLGLRAPPCTITAHCGPRSSKCRSRLSTCCGLPDGPATPCDGAGPQFRTRPACDGHGPHSNPQPLDQGLISNRPRLATRGHGFVTHRRLAPPVLLFERVCLSADNARLSNLRTFRSRLISNCPRLSTGSTDSQLIDGSHRLSHFSNLPACRPTRPHFEPLDLGPRVHLEPPTPLGGGARIAARQRLPTSRTASEPAPLAGCSSVISRGSGLQHTLQPYDLEARPVTSLAASTGEVSHCGRRQGATADQPKLRHAIPCCCPASRRASRGRPLRHPGEPGPRFKGRRSAVYTFRCTALSVLQVTLLLLRTSQLRIKHRDSAVLRNQPDAKLILSWRAMNPTRCAGTTERRLPLYDG